MDSTSEISICPECDLVQKTIPLGAGESAYCARCSEELACGSFDQSNTVLALLVTSLILIVVMNAFPLVEMRFNGIARETTLLGAIYTLYQQDMNFLAALVLATTIVSPVIEIGLLALMFVRPQSVSARLPDNSVFRLIHSLQTWSMVEVFMLGVLVALVKLAALAEIIPGPAIGACLCLIIVLTTLKRIIRPEQLWRFYHEGHQ